MGTRLKISRGGQVSVPASVRTRWSTSVVTAEDHGDHLVLRPAPEDPIDAAFGAFADELRGVDLGRLREEMREEEIEAEDRTWGPA